MTFAVSPDERWVATTHDADTAPAVAVGSTSGGAWTDVFSAGRGGLVFAMEWTRGSGELLVSRLVGSGRGPATDAELWAVALDRGTPLGARRLGVIRGLTAPRKFRVSPDGRVLLFTAGSPAIHDLGDARAAPLVRRTGGLLARRADDRGRVIARDPDG
jgi:hypothetical protein